MDKLEHLYKELKGKFPENLWTDYEFDKDIFSSPELSNKLSAFKDSLINIQNAFFEGINFSILQGEYTNELECKKHLQELKNLIDTISPSIIPVEDFVADFLYTGGFKTNFIASLNLAINLYSELINSFHSKINVTDKEYLFRPQNELLNALENKDFDAISINNLRFLSYNISIARSDLFLEADSDGQDLSDLFEIHRQILNKFNDRILSYPLIAKCKFLICKLILRSRYENKGNVYYIDDAQEKALDFEEFEDESFGEWLAYLQTHYSDETYSYKSDWKEIIKKEYANCKNEKLIDNSNIQLHRKIKFFKDINVGLSERRLEIKKIRDEFDSRLEKSKGNLFDSYAYSIAINYTINNEFSIICKDQDSTPEEVESLYNEILKVQNLTSVKNFFPQTKYLEFLLKKLKDYYNQREVLLSLTMCQEIIKKCDKVIGEYEGNVKWANKNYNYVFQLPYNDCLVDIKLPDGTISKIFLFSSFLMPISKQKMLLEFESNKREVLQLEASIKVFENISDDILKAKADIVTLKDKEVRTMEMLAIFTAIISFVASSLPTFKFIETPLQAALFVFALGTSFAAFVLLLLIAFREKNKLKERTTIIVSTIIIVSLIWGALIYSSNNNRIDELNKPNIHQTDSTKLGSTKDTGSQLIEKDSSKHRYSPSSPQ